MSSEKCELRKIISIIQTFLSVFLEPNAFNTCSHQCVLGISDSEVNLPAGCKPWSNAMEILDEKDGVDTELLVYVMTLINKVGTGVTTALNQPWLRRACVIFVAQGHGKPSLSFAVRVFFVCRHLQAFQNRIRSMTWWTFWRSRASKPLLRGTSTERALT